MDLANELRNSLKDHLGWGKPRLVCFISMLLAVLRIQRMDLSRLAVAMGGSADVTSRYRRLQRFFSEVRFDYDALARLIVRLFGFDRQPFYLTLDRTNWQWGKKNLNLLTLGIVYKGAAIPVYWLVLNKKGNSSQRERIALLKRFVCQFGNGSIQGILGDREFIGEQWWGWLNQQQIPFVIRMKANQLYRINRGVSVPWVRCSGHWHRVNRRSYAKHAM